MQGRYLLFGLRAGWLKLIGIALCIGLWVWSGLGQFQIPASYNGFVDYMRVASSQNAAEAMDVDEATLSGAPEEAYRRYLDSMRDFVYTKPVSMTVLTGFLICEGLMVLLIYGLFQKRTTGLLLSAGVSRGRLFLAVSALYWLAVLLVWAAAAWLMRAAWSVRFAPEERDWFLLTQASWGLMVLGMAALPYFFIFLTQKALPAFLLALGCFLLMMLLPFLGDLTPAGMLRQTEPWQPGADPAALLRVDIVSGVMVVLSWVGAWLSFRKRGQN